MWGQVSKGARAGGAQWTGQIQAFRPCGFGEWWRCGGGGCPSIYSLTAARIPYGVISHWIHYCVHYQLR